MKNFRVIRLANACHYPGVLRDYVRINPNWHQQSYAEQKAIWDSQHYVYGDSFSHWMKKLGNEALDIIVDSVPLQSQWAREHGIDTTKESWQLDVILGQIGEFKPDIVYLQDVHALPFNVRKNLKQIFSFIKAVVIFRGYPGGSLSYFSEFCDADLILVGAPVLVDKFAQLGRQTHLVYHSFDHRVNRSLKQDAVNRQQLPFSFVGTLGFGSSEHNERAQLLSYISAQWPMTIFSDDSAHASKGLVVDKVVWMSARMLRNPLTRALAPQILRHKHLFPVPLKQKVKNFISRGRPAAPQLTASTKILSGVYGLNMYQALADSKISFNIHSNAGRGVVENMRMFQAPGVGSCLLTDWGKNIRELFEPDEEVVCYNSPQECADKLKQLMNDDKLRANIAAKGQQRVMRDHTVEKRVSQIHSVIANSL